MPPVDQLAAQYLPPVVAAAAVAAGVVLRFLKLRGEARASEWDRMRDLLDELRKQRDHLDALVERLTADNARLRRDLREAIRGIHHKETPDVGTAEE